MQLIDRHCDTIYELKRRDDGSSLAKNSLSIDLDGMRRAGTILQIFACFIYRKEWKTWEDGYAEVFRLLDRMEQEVEENKDEIRIVHNGSEIEKNRKCGKISAMASLEEGGVLDGKPERLKVLKQRGIRLITLTWNYENCIGYPNSRERTAMEMGLKPFGKMIVKEMNRQGILIDVSHLSDGGFWDCIRLSEKPVIASHSNCRALCGHPRNLSDEMLRALGETGGVAGLNFYPHFVRENGKRVTRRTLCEHTLHMIRKGGEDLPAIGSDFDGYEIEEPKNEAYISHVGEMELLWECMKQCGITERQLDKIWHGNAMRVLSETGGEINESSCL